MATRRKFVNIDAMIPRGDFAVIDNADVPSSGQISGISVRDLQEDAPLLPNLRKPDFQRETNHWSPAQLELLIRSFVDGDVIPSVILWSSPAAVFVIDGGHRLSALRAWLLDDYGDGPLSQQYFGYRINDYQKKAAQETRKLVEKSIGPWQHWVKRNQQPDLPDNERKRVKNVMTRAIPVQWVIGDAERAEVSFFKINKQGTPLDNIETLLIGNRKRPGAIAARSIIRAGMGHKYWSRFDTTTQKEIEEKATDIYEVLFEPEIHTPLKTLDLPLGGGVGVGAALELLIDFILIASRNQQGQPLRIEDQTEDGTGAATMQVLNNSLRLASRITGNDGGSLGLHPAVYFYGSSGRHVAALFMGMALLIARKLANNDSGWFIKFTKCRRPLEETLIQHKPLIGAIIGQTHSGRRYSAATSLFEYIIESITAGVAPTEQGMVDKAGVAGKIIVGTDAIVGQQFSDDTKSAVYLKQALGAALRCDICGGFLDPNKSLSYDHKQARREGGIGNDENCQLTHPYCNNSRDVLQDVHPDLVTAEGSLST